MDLTSEVNEYLEMAALKQVSDVSFFPSSQGYVVQYKSVKGIERIAELTAEMGIKMINHLKFLGQMGISEHRRPQLGSLQMQLNNEQVFLRLSSVGDFKNHESLVVRIIYGLDDQQLNYLLPEQLDEVRTMIHKRGIILFSGPMGSGKTTTMYQLLREISNDQSVMSIEDPVEIVESTFLQLQVNQSAGITYSELLKVGLRHRPDIFLIGEIRDEVTANAAIRAALSGHTVLTTVHSQSAQGCVDRLRHFGVAEEYLQQVLKGALYQRLLPTSNGFGCLFEIKNGQDLFSRAAGENEFSEWQANLNKLRLKGEITSETKDEYWEG